MNTNQSKGNDQQVRDDDSLDLRLLFAGLAA